MPRHRRPRVRSVRTERAGSDRLREVQPQGGVLTCDPVDRGLDCAGNDDPGALGTGGSRAVPASESDRPGKFARAHFYVVVCPW